MHGVVLVLLRLGAVLGNGCGIQGQNYAAIFRPNEQKVKDCFPRGENMNLFFDSDMVNPLLKTNMGRDRRLNFVRRQLFCHLVRCHN